MGKNVLTKERGTRSVREVVSTFVLSKPSPVAQMLDFLVVTFIWTMGLRESDDCVHAALPCIRGF